MDNHTAKLFDVEGRVILITGAMGFFGRHITKLFLELGACVILMSHNKDIHHWVTDLRAQYSKGSEKVLGGYEVDFYDSKKLKKILLYIECHFHVDVIINNAYDMGTKTGFDCPAGSLENLSLKEWEFSFLSGLYWAFLIIQVIGGKMKEVRCGSIINIASMYALISPDPDLYKEEKYFNPVPYGSVKAGLCALTRYVASFWGEYGVRCNALVPGSFPNPDKVRLQSGFMDKLESKTALGRVGELEELDGMLVYLASDASSYTTGQSLVVDGGWTIK